MMVVCVCGLDKSFQIADRIEGRSVRVFPAM